MRSSFKYFAIPALFLLVSAGFEALAARAATPPSTAKSTTKAQTSAPAMTDAQFVKAAAEGGYAEVKLGQLAEQKGATQQVKDFGKRMVDDHSKADSNLKTAVSKDIPSESIPNQLDTKDQATYDRLSKLSGTAFDRAYAQDMVTDHVADIAAFRHESNDGKDVAIKDFASQTLPTLQTHLKLAREMEQSVTAGNTSSTKKVGS